MSRSKLAPAAEPILESFANSEIETLSDAANAIHRIKSQIHYSIQRNIRQRSLLDRAEIQAQTILLLLQQVNHLDHETNRSS